LDATEYIKLKNKEEVESEYSNESIGFFVLVRILFYDFQDAASSFGKILFKRRKKPGEEDDPIEGEKKPKTSQLDLIFNLKNGEEQPELEEESEPTETDEKETIIIKKKLLQDEEPDVKYGLQQPAKKRFCDGPTSKTTTLPAAKVLAREAKAGNKKMLSFYDEEEEEAEEYSREDFREKREKEDEREANDSS